MSVSSHAVYILKDMTMGTEISLRRTVTGQPNCGGQTRNRDLLTVGALAPNAARQTSVFVSKQD